MANITVYRNHGAIRALLDVYERSIDELIAVIKEISNNELIEVIDPYTNDGNCRSVQTILTHVVLVPLKLENGWEKKSSTKKKYC